MGHDHHFLSRLDRVTSEHLDLALQLYRSSELVRELLRRHTSTPDDDRVAISLDYGSFGPYVIVKGDGTFVTCLGRGMSLGSRKLIKRTDLDAAMDAVRVFHERARVLHTLRPDGDERSLWKRVTHGGEFVSREEMMALLALRPAYAEGLCNLAREACEAVASNLARASKIESFRPRDRDPIRVLYQIYWGTAHLGVLLGSDSGELAALPEWNKRLESIGLATFATGVRPVVLRGLYALTSDPDIGLESCRTAWYEHRATMSWLMALHGFTLLALRYPRLEQEVRRILHTEPALAEPEHAPYARWCCRVARGVLDDPREACSHLDHNARLSVYQEGLSLPQDSPARFARPAEVPTDLARAHDLRVMAPAFLDPEPTMDILCRLPWIASMSPESFYEPAGMLKAVHRPSELETGKRFVAAIRKAYERKAQRKTPVRGPGPNEACTCGSGRKWKKCCGAPRSLSSGDFEPVRQCA